MAQCSCRFCEIVELFQIIGKIIVRFYLGLMNILDLNGHNSNIKKKPT